MPTLDKKTLCKIMKRLADERPRFCSEADFQFALAWKIQENYPDAEIRFECPAKLPDNPNARTQIDIIVKQGGSLVPIELKYKLKSHGAETDNRKRMLHDIDRLEKLQIDGLELFDMNFADAPKTIKNRFAIWLSDNDRYWKENGKGKVDHKKYTVSWDSYAGDFMFALIDISERRS